MCKIMQISRSSYYEWLQKPKCARAKKDEELLCKINTVFQEGRCTYGARRIKRRLARQGAVISRRRIIRLMKEPGLVCKTKRKFKATTDSKHGRPVAPNVLERKFTVDKPNRYWVGDISYVPTAEGWLYLATVIDLYSRKVIGWSMANNLKADLADNALLMAIWQRKPDKGVMPPRK
jgi:putative transposase